MSPVEGRTPIAEYEVIWVLPSGERKPGRIAICAPEPDPHPDVKDDATWGCWLAVEGLQPRPLFIRGAGSMQPLALALEFVGHDLHALIASGGMVLDPNEPGPSGVLSIFRVLMRRTSDPMPLDPVLAEIDAAFARDVQQDDDADSEAP